MPNTNLIMSNNIDGNISSCKTEVAIVNCASRDNLFYCYDRGYATNNCTGQTEILNSWSLTKEANNTICFTALILFTVVFYLVGKKLFKERK